MNVTDGQIDGHHAANVNENDMPSSHPPPLNVPEVTAEKNSDAD